MNLLLDTHAVLWFFATAQNLNKKSRPQRDSKARKAQRGAASRNDPLKRPDWQPRRSGGRSSRTWQKS